MTEPTNGRAAGPAPNAVPRPEFVEAVQRAMTAGGGKAEDIARFVGPLAIAARDSSITTKRRLGLSVAHVGHESGGFSKTRENLNYSAEALLERWPVRPVVPGKPDTNYRRYTPELAAAHARKPELIANHIYARPELGNGAAASGDGWRYRGRGLIQLTGKANYAECGRALGIDLIADPDRLADDPYVAAAAAGWFWRRNKLNALADLPSRADALHRTTLVINGGLSGLEDRAARFDRIIAALAGFPENLEA